MRYTMYCIVAFNKVVGGFLVASPAGAGLIASERVGEWSHKAFLSAYLATSVLRIILLSICVSLENEGQ